MSDVVGIVITSHEVVAGYVCQAGEGVAEVHVAGWLPGTEAPARQERKRDTRDLSNTEDCKASFSSLFLMWDSSIVKVYETPGFTTD
jgi:hypothetical protein